MDYVLGNMRWFQWVERLHRPYLSWGLATWALIYGSKGVFGWGPFELTEFFGFCGAAGVAHLGRGVEKVAGKKIEGDVVIAQAKAIEAYAVSKTVDDPDG